MASTVTMMKKDAVINLQVGAGFLQKVQQVLTALASELTSEQLEDFKKLVQEGKTEFPEEWMDHVFTLSAFVRNIEAEAIKQGATYEQDVNSINTLEG
jgi:hypothetical protein